MSRCFSFSSLSHKTCSHERSQAGGAARTFDPLIFRIGRIGGVLERNLFQLCSIHTPRSPYGSMRSRLIAAPPRIADSHLDGAEASPALLASQPWLRRMPALASPSTRADLAGGRVWYLERPGLTSREAKAGISDARSDLSHRRQRAPTPSAHGRQARERTGDYARATRAARRPRGAVKGNAGEGGTRCDVLLGRSPRWRLPLPAW